MLPAVIAREGAGSGVEAAVAIRTVFVPVAGPWLDGTGISHAAVAACGANHVARLVIHIVGGGRAGQGASYQCAGCKAHDAGRYGVTAMAMVMAPAPVAGIGSGKRRERRGAERRDHDGGLHKSVHFRLLRPVRRLGRSEGGYEAD